MKSDWLECWSSGNIPFHLPTINPLLEKYWPQLNINPASYVLVPLCGKTLDLVWLAKVGHHVIGVELSPIACEAFFIENRIPFNKKTENVFTCYDSEKIKLYCGDFFELTPTMLPSIDYVYDRAAIVTFPNALRQQYIDHLTQLIAPQSQILLIAIDSPDKIKGPPYPLSLHHIKKLLGKKFQINRLLYEKRTDIPPRLYDIGYHEIYEVVYRLVKNESLKS